MQVLIQFIIDQHHTCSSGLSLDFEVAGYTRKVLVDGHKLKIDGCCCVVIFIP